MGKRGGKMEGQNLESKKDKDEILTNKVVRWTSIGTLILGLIAGVVLTTIFNIRNEKSQFANITIVDSCFSPDRFCNGAIYIKNNGPANAENFVLTLSIYYLNNSWKNAVDSIDSFKLTTMPFSMIPKISYINLNAIDGYAFNNKNNTISIVINSLPPNQEIMFKISYDAELIKTKEANEHLEGLVTNNSSRKISTYDLYTLLDDYFAFKYEIASIAAYASCDNCIGGNSPIYFTTGVLDNFTLDAKNEITKDGKQRFIAKIDTSYLIPIDEYPSSTNSQLDLKIYENKNGLYIDK
jgi:hypothetical protein